MPRKSHQLQRPGPGWFTKTEMAGVFDVSPRSWESTYRRYASPEATRLVDGQAFFHCRLVVEAWREQSRQKPEGKPDDPLLIGNADSPALEEYRKARARLAWMEVEQREKTHVPLTELEPALLALTGVLRGAGDSLARKYGNDAAAILNEAIDQWEAGIEKHLPHDADATAAEEDGAGDPHAAVADDAGVR